MEFSDYTMNNPKILIARLLLLIIDTYQLQLLQQDILFYISLFVKTLLNQQQDFKKIRYYYYYYLEKASCFSFDVHSSAKKPVWKQRIIKNI